MEREILFRGKRVDNGECVYGHFCEFPCDDGKDIPSILRIEDKENERIIMQYPIISETVGRFTGLTDRNGVRIFEGDILEHDSGAFHEVVFEQRNGNAYFGWVINENETWHFDSEFLRQLQVIGNIHDNPEMLKEEK